MRTNRFGVVVAAVSLICVAAHDAQAFYNPSTGRWLSRDPTQEQGGLNLYSFIANRPLNDVDYIGLEQLSKLLAYYRQLNEYLLGDQMPGDCCCKNRGPVPDVAISFSASGATAKGSLTLTLGNCASLVEIYWWDCYSAHEEAQAHGVTVDWTDWGWSAGSRNYSKTAKPGFFNQFYDPGDASHLMMQACVFISYCDPGGLERIKPMPSDWGYFTWNYDYSWWMEPGHRPPQPPIFEPPPNSPIAF
jgi:hypothetical protein